MKMVGYAVMLIGGPMALMLLLYRLIDRKGKKTAKLVEKFPVLKKNKFIIQVIAPVIFVLLFGFLSLIFRLPVYIFFIVTGAVLGIINGMSITIMYND